MLPQVSAKSINLLSMQLQSQFAGWHRPDCWQLQPPGDSTNRRLRIAQCKGDSWTCDRDTGALLVQPPCQQNMSRKWREKWQMSLSQEESDTVHFLAWVHKTSFTLKKSWSLSKHCWTLGATEHWRRGTWLYNIVI